MALLASFFNGTLIYGAYFVLIDGYAVASIETGVGGGWGIAG
jgi:hypothetical protein